MNDVSADAYQSNLSIWDRKSSIRSRPRRILQPEQKTEYFYPLARQPIAIHPYVTSRGEDAIRFVLIHSVYKFMNDIAILETEVVNKGALMIAHDHLKVNFPEAMRHDSLSIIIDEAYHAYVAIDYLKQVEVLTGVAPLVIPTETTVIRAMTHIKNKLPVEKYPLFELIAVCIGEHGEIPFDVLVDKLKIEREPHISPLFQILFLMQDAADNIHLQLDGHCAREITFNLGVAIFDITLNVIINDEALEITAQYNTDLFEAYSIKHFLDHYTHFITWFANRLDEKIFEFDILNSHGISKSG